MSTFEVLRYGDTDITDREALIRLPEPIVERFWTVIHEPEEIGTAGVLIHPIMCMSLARWAKTAHTLREREYVRGKFHRALKEVEPCDGTL